MSSTGHSDSGTDDRDNDDDDDDDASSLSSSSSEFDTDETVSKEEEMKRLLKNCCTCLRESCRKCRPLWRRNCALCYGEFMSPKHLVVDIMLAPYCSSCRVRTDRRLPEEGRIDAAIKELLTRVPHLYSLH